MNRPSMRQPYDLWHWDGSLRDIYLGDADIRDWGILLELASTGECRYSVDGKRRALSTAENIFSNRKAFHFLEVRLGSASISCQFFVPTEIELNIDPREVADEATHQAILQFLEELARRANKRIAITAENCPGTPYLAFNPDSQQWVVYEADFKSNGI